jgi:hypothetical protein
MPSLDTEAQFKFLLCCIKHSAAGKVSHLLQFPRLQAPQRLNPTTNPT